jgi:hypothetical protein
VIASQELIEFVLKSHERSNVINWCAADLTELFQGRSEFLPLFGIHANCGSIRQSEMVSETR